MIAWSSYDAAAKTYALRVLRGGAAVDTAAVARSGEPFDLDVGPGPDGEPLVVYSRRGDIFQFDPATGAEQPLAEVNTKGTEVHPSISRSALAFVRTPRDAQGAADAVPAQGRRHAQAAAAEVQGDAGDRGRRAERPRPVRRLSDRHRAECCTRAVLYRVDGKKLRRLFYVGSGGANFGQLVTPSVVGRSVFFARTNDGSGQGNNLFRLDLRTKQAVRGARDQPRGVGDLARRPLPDEPQLRRLHRPARHGPDRDADLRARDHGPAGVQEGVEGGPPQDTLLKPV